jgi:hypothetical protein
LKIYANGCSFTYGHELESPQESAWPRLISNHLGGTLVNRATPGGTNQRTVYHTVKDTHDDYDLYLIAWSDYSRFTFYKSENNFEINFNAQMKHDLYTKESFYREWGDTLYKHWYNELFAFKLWLQQIIQLQLTLQDKNYLMINTMPNNLSLWLAPKESFIGSVKHLINFDSMTDEQIIDEYNEIQYYISLIDTAKFYKWNDFYITDLCTQFSVGPGGHILEQGHKNLSNLIIEHLCLK